MNKIFSLLLLVFLLPLIFIVGFIIMIDNGFPIFFKQKRIGLNNKLFWIYKFRTMKTSTPDLATHLVTDKSDFYTKSGPFIRKYSLDELPQLINIIKGDINFIGPRPALHNQKNLIKLRKDLGIHKVSPGITGWAQVNGRDELDNFQKVEMDKYYIENKSISLDLKILGLTIFKALMGSGVKK
tara:strand:+ start:20181 stop:20729 length:549 start_codon:yes stop_codon:yes gene_type:complete